MTNPIAAAARALLEALDRRHALDVLVKADALRAALAAVAGEAGPVDVERLIPPGWRLIQADFSIIDAPGRVSLRLTPDREERWHRQSGPAAMDNVATPPLYAHGRGRTVAAAILDAAERRGFCLTCLAKCGECDCAEAGRDAEFVYEDPGNPIGVQA